MTSRLTSLALFLPATIVTLAVCVVVVGVAILDDCITGNLE